MNNQVTDSSNEIIETLEPIKRNENDTQEKK